MQLLCSVSTNPRAPARQTGEWSDLPEAPRVLQSQRSGGIDNKGKGCFLFLSLGAADGCFDWFLKNNLGNGKLVNVHR